MATWGSTLRAARKRAGQSQEHVAEYVGVNRTSLSRYEDGKRYPTVDVLAKWLDILRYHVSAEQVLREMGVGLNSPTIADLPPALLLDLLDMSRDSPDDLSGVAGIVQRLRGPQSHQGGPS